MILNFIFSNSNTLVLSIWMLFLVIVAIRYFQPTRAILSKNIFLLKIGKKIGNISFIKLTLSIIDSFFGKISKIFHLNLVFTNIRKIIKSISFLKLILIAIGLNIFYGLFISWGQYHIWATAANYTKMLVDLPLPANVPIVSYLEWTRHLFFENHLGYFLYYVWGHFWLNIFISFSLSGALYFIFKFWESRRGSFDEHGPELFLILALISGWPGILVFVSLGFIFVILFSAYSNFRGIKVVPIEPAFVIASIVALPFTHVLVEYFFKNLI